MDCLSFVRRDSMSFNKEQFGNIFYKKQKLETRLKGIQKKLEVVDSSNL